MTNKAILVGAVYFGQPYDIHTSMQELEALANACDIEVADVFIQKMDHINISTYIGKGKVEEVQMQAEATGSDFVIVNEELSPSQLVNLEELLACKVLDRTTLILEIFARRAATKEAKLQVEIATLRYMLPRLIGLSTGIYSQQGGSGFRGIGETKLELDRRKIKHQITVLEEELKEAVRQRQIQRSAREKKELPVVAIVGYTNSGKSTLLNWFLTSYGKEEKQVLAKDMLFATLETATRSITLDDNKQFLLTDTVGFVDQLPHHLVKAFRSTLEEVKEADLLLHVVDLANPTYPTQIEVTNQVLEEIGVKEIPMIYVYNKADLNEQLMEYRNPFVKISALQKQGMPELLGAIRTILFSTYQVCMMRIPYEDSAVYAYLKHNAHLIAEEETEDGYNVEVELSPKDFAIYQSYIQ